MIREEFLYFEKLNLDHVLKMRNWGQHTDPLLQDYNFDFSTEAECKDFLLQKTFSPLNKYYAIIYCEEVIGFLGNKNINVITKSSTLGLVLNPDIVSMGFGQMVLKKFLQIYFTEKKMKRMDLLVAGYNTRARHLYNKLGFKEIKKLLDKYPNPYLDENSKEFIKFKDEFVRDNGILFNYVYKMELRKEDFKFEVSS